MGVRDGDGFVNSAGTAGPIRTRDGSFDAPERQNDDGGGHVALRATCRRVPPREPFEKRKKGLQPKGPRAQTFKSEAIWSELCDI